MKKRTFYTELAFAVGLFLLALGTALLERAGFGISMVVAPAYILHLKVSQTLPWFSFGMAEYLLQAAVLVVMMVLLRRVKPVYFLSVVTAVIYGFLLDGSMWLVGLIPDRFWVCLILFAAGELICAAAISLLFQSYLPPEVYEMFVKEVSKRLGIRLHIFKIIYDCVSLVVSVGLSFALLGSIQGIGIGTVICALTNGFLIRMFTKIFEKIWVFRDRFVPAAIFQEREETV